MFNLFLVTRSHTLYCPYIIKKLTANWANLLTFFEYPKDIRKTIYTTNEIESLNSVIIRSATKRIKLFTNKESAIKVIYLAITQAAKKWTMPIHNWRLALNCFIIEFSERV